MEKKYKRPEEQKGLPTNETKGSLRRHALRLLDYKPAKVDDFSKADLSSLIHELRVYHAELEIQNEELLRIQLELEESRNKYLDLYNFAPVGYFTLNANTIILDVNLAGAELLGIEKKFLIGKRFTQYIALKNHDVFYSYRKRLLKTNTRQSCELEMLKKDGTFFYSRLDSVAVFNSEGDFVHFRIAILDVTEQKQSRARLDKTLDELEIRVQEQTSQLLKANEALRAEISERKQAEIALRASEERFHGAFDYAAIGMALVAPDGRWLKVNRSLCQIIGYYERELLATDFQAITHPDDLDKELEYVGRALAGEINAYRMEKRYLHKLGHPVWALLSVSLVRDSLGSPLYFIKQIQDITEQRQAEETLRENFVQQYKKNRYETIIRTVTQAVHQSISLEDVLENAAQSMSENIDKADCVSINLVEGEHAVVRAYRGLPNWYIEQAGRIPYPRGFTWKTITEGKSGYCPDVDQDTVIGPAGRKLGIKSYLSIPISLEGRTLGCINISSFQKNAFDEEELKLIEVVTKQIGVAIGNAEQAGKLESLYDALSNRNKELEILNAITQAVHRSFDLQEIYRIALDKVTELENVDAVMIYLIDEERQEAVLQAHINLRVDYVRRAGKIPYPKGLTWKAINAGRVINIEDAQKDPDTGPAGRDLGHHGSVGIPIFLQEKVIGVIWFVRYKEHKFSEKEISFLSTIGNQIAIAIAKAKQYRELSRKNRYEAVISSVTKAVHQSIDLQDVLENAVEAMSEEIEGVENIGIYLVEGKEAVLRAYRGYPGWFVGRVGRMPYPKGFTWKTIIEGKLVYCADTDRDTVIGPAGKDLGTKSYAAMPFGFQDQTVGVININSLRRYAFQREELRLLEIIAQQIEIAINNAKKAEALRESERRFRNMADTAPIMIWMSGVDKLCSYVNKGWLEFTGRTMEQELGSGWTESVHSDDLKQCLENYFTAFDARQEFEMEYRLKRFDGEYRWVFDKGVPRFLPDGSFIGYIGSSMAITERKNAEERLNSYARQLQNLSHRLMRVQETERRFLARELHDEIGQVLTGVKINLLALQGLDEGSSYITRLRESILVVDKALEQVRDLSLNLRPSMLDDLGLVATLRWYINQQAQLGGFVSKFTTSPDNMHFELNLGTVCFRTVQEALTNVLRHANAKKVSVELRQHDSTLELVVCDDGIGFDLNVAQERMARGLSFGLLSMQERVQLVGGRIEIKSKPNKGTIIRAYFPLSFES